MHRMVEEMGEPKIVSNTTKAMRAGTSSGLFAFGFHAATAEEIADQRVWIDEQVPNQRATLAARMVADAERKKEREREKTRERVQDLRERRKQVEISEGVRDAVTGKKHKLDKVNVLRSHVAFILTNLH